MALTFSTFATLGSVTTASAAPAVVTVGSASTTLAGTNIPRAAEALVLYTRTATQTVTPTNMWGAEATVVNGKITLISDRQATSAGPVAIPLGGAVLSGHGAARVWLLDNARIGVAVTLPGAVSTPVTTGPLSIGTSTYHLSAVDAPRAADALVMYTRAGGQVTSPANEWGAEAAVVAGKVVELRDRQFTGLAAMAIPVGGYVLSGHSVARVWLLDNAKVGALVRLPGAAATPAPTTSPTAAPSPTAIPTIAPTVAPTVAPAPSPTVAPPVTSGNLPNKVVGGYLTTWEGRNGVTLRSVVDNTNYNLIYVAFAVGVSANSGTLTLDLPPGAGSPAEFNSQIAYANSKGKKVIVSVGGYFDLTGQNIGYRLDSSAKVDQLMASLRDYRNNWGFIGMDWDLEQGNRPDNAGIIDASRRMRSEFGPSYIICFAPGPNLSSWIGAGGVLDTLGTNGWDAVGEQIYDMGQSEAGYQSSIVNRMTALANKYGANKVLLGNKYKNDSGTSLYDPSNNFVDLATTKAALATLRSSGKNIRGSFHWTIQGDSDVGPYTWAGANGVGGDILRNP